MLILRQRTKLFTFSKLKTVIPSELKVFFMKMLANHLQHNLVLLYCHLNLVLLSLSFFFIFLVFSIHAVLVVRQIQPHFFGWFPSWSFLLGVSESFSMAFSLISKVLAGSCSVSLFFSSLSFTSSSSDRSFRIYSDISGLISLAFFSLVICFPNF